MPSPVSVRRTNTILYCSAWRECVAFYRDIFGFPETFRNDWFVEFGLGDGAHLSVADAAHATIDAGHGGSVTLSWEVADIVTIRNALRTRGAATGELHQRWGATAFQVLDPDGHRIELWEDGDAAGEASGA